VADETDQEQRTEPASGQRIQRAWDEGQIPLGHDAVIVAGLVVASLTLIGLSGTLRSGLSDLVAFTAGSLDRLPFRDLGPIAARPVGAALAVLAAAALASVTATMVQTKGRVWLEKVAPDPGRLFGPERLARLFSKDLLVDLLLATAKVSLLAGAAWSVARRHAAELTSLLTATPEGQLSAIGRTILEVARPTVAVAVALAGAQWGVSRWRWARKLRMTKEEVRRENREEDGDPQVKGKRKKRHREFSRNRARREVPRADALLVNPTHIAIALRYRRSESRAPRVTAKGKGVLAEYMRELARQNGIPIVEDIPLARLLYRQVKVGREIPAQTYRAVAAILAFVYRVTGRKPGAGVLA